MAVTLYEQILEMFPLVSYEEDRAREGCISLAEEAEVRTLAEGVTYKKCRYRSNGQCAPGGGCDFNCR